MQKDMIDGGEEENGESVAAAAAATCAECVVLVVDIDTPLCHQ